MEPVTGIGRRVGNQYRLRSGRRSLRHVRGLSRTSPGAFRRCHRTARRYGSEVFERQPGNQVLRYSCRHFSGRCDQPHRFERSTGTISSILLVLPDTGQEGLAIISMEEREWAPSCGNGVVHAEEERSQQPQSYASIRSMAEGEPKLPPPDPEPRQPPPPVPQPDEPAAPDVINPWPEPLQAYWGVSACKS
jgi:hypothetical protein